MPLIPGPGTEFANFGDRDLLLGLTSEEAWINLTDDDLQVSRKRKWVDRTCAWHLLIQHERSLRVCSLQLIRFDQLGRKS